MIKTFNIYAILSFIENCSCILIGFLPLFLKIFSAEISVFRAIITGIISLLYRLADTLLILEFEDIIDIYGTKKKY